MNTTDHLTTLTLGDRLRRARRFAKLSQAQMAAAVGVSRPSISTYENDVTPPSFETVVLWAQATDVPVDFFAAACPRWDSNPRSSDYKLVPHLALPFPDAA